MQSSPDAPQSDDLSLAQQAISAALCANWLQAVKLNEKIIGINNQDVEALNRLSRSLSCLGNITKAQKMYKKVLVIDPYNIIALKNIEKLSKINSSSVNGNGISAQIIPNTDFNLSKVFLDEPGKTKIVSLLNLASPMTIAYLNCGDRLNINPKNHSITVTNQSGTYLGAFPDDLAHRLLAFIAGGNVYEAFVKSATSKSITIFVRETVRSPKFGNQPTFQTKSSLFADESTH